MYPNNIAVKKANAVVSYAELNAMSNRLALAILSIRDNSPEPIGLLFENGAQLMAAMIGVLQAGKFFVVLDPALPAQRIKVQLEDSQAALLVTNYHDQVLSLDEIRHQCSLLKFDFASRDGSHVEPLRPRSSRDLALIFYTSGSTGAAKGVPWRHDTYHISPNDHIALLTSGASNTVTNSFLALLNGAALMLFDVQNNGVEGLAHWLIQESISICWISAPLFRSLALNLSGKESFPELRVIQLKSEAVHGSDIDLYRKYFSATYTLVTGLATTETGLLNQYFFDKKDEGPIDEHAMGGLVYRAMITGTKRYTTVLYTVPLPPPFSCVGKCIISVA